MTRAFDINLLLHEGRSALLRDVPKGAETFLSAGCAGLWYFEWVGRCYGDIRKHIGLEFYTPKPDGLPSNVQWIENTCSDMRGIADRSCDLVFSGQNYEHLWPKELLGFFLEAARVTSPGGMLVVDSPNRTITEQLRTWSHPEHTVEATVQEAVELVTLAGFDVVVVKGVWLNRDPVTKEMLPFEPTSDQAWSVSERLICASSRPEDSFIWWIEAVRSQRAADDRALSQRINGIFREAWPERMTRFSSHAGQTIMRGGEEWVQAGSGQEGALIFGPYLPLPPGSYTCRFTVEAEPGGAATEPHILCDVMISRPPRPIVSERVVVDGKIDVVLNFSLEQLEFGVQFRCISLGRKKVMCKKSVNVVPIVKGRQGDLTEFLLGYDFVISS